MNQEVLEVEGDELDELDETEEFQIDEYDLTSTPNDFNVLTINNFIESGAIKIPGFQRNYVWDIKRASKLIESIILGLPVPQIFLYEDQKNQFLVIDGQQRLLTIYYYIKQRFPKKEKRTELRKIFAEQGIIGEEILNDDEYFVPFKLSLSDKAKAQKNPFNGLLYKTLGQYRIQFELRPIRNVIVKQNVPKGDKSSVFEIFNRLNSGGINLMPQEIRSSLYHSDFFDMLYKLNLAPGWRRILRSENPDLHMKDIELILRGYAIMIKGDEYSPSLAKFLNTFAGLSQKFSAEDISYLKDFFPKFLNYISDLPDDAFISKTSKRFNTFLFEGVLYSLGKKHYLNRTFPEDRLDIEIFNRLKEDPEFTGASIKGTTNKDTLEKRLERSNIIFNGTID